MSYYAKLFYFVCIWMTDHWSLPHTPKLQQVLKSSSSSFSPSSSSPSSSSSHHVAICKFCKTCKTDYFADLPTNLIKFPLTRFLFMWVTQKCLISSVICHNILVRMAYLTWTALSNCNKFCTTATWLQMILHNSSTPIFPDRYSPKIMANQHDILSLCTFFSKCLI